MEQMPNGETNQRWRIDLEAIAAIVGGDYNLMRFPEKICDRGKGLSRSD